MKSLILALMFMFFCQASLAQKIIAIQGHYTLQAKPEFIILDFSINNEYEAKPDKAKTYLDKKTNSVLNALFKLGVDKKDVITQGFELDSYRECDEKKEVYKIGRSFEVTLRNLKKYNEFIDILSREGVSEIGYPTVGVKNEADYQKQALEGAIKDAKQQAKFLAASFDAVLGGVYAIGKKQTTNRYNVEEIIVAGARRSIGKNAHVYFNPAPMEIEASIYVEFLLENKQ